MSPEAIASSAGLLGDVAGWFGARQNTKDAQAWQEKMWYRQNEYNLPYNQRQRLEAGGFNPHLMYGTGSLANTAGSVGSPTPTAMKQLDFGRHVQMYIENKRANEALQLNKDAMQLSRDRLEQQKFMDFFKMANINADTLNKGLSAESGAFDLKLKKKLESNNIQMSNNVLKELEQKILQGKTSLDQQIQRFEHEKSLYPEELSQAKSKTYMDMIEAHNFSKFTQLRLKNLLQEYDLALQQNNRDNARVLHDRIRVALERERLTKDEVMSFFDRFNEERNNQRNERGRNERHRTSKNFRINKFR